MLIGHQKPAPGANDEGTGFSDNLVAGYAGDSRNKLSLSRLTALPPAMCRQPLSISEGRTEF